MRSSTLLAFFAVTVVGFSFAGCNCGGNPPITDPDASTDGGPDGGPDETCVLTGNACSTEAGADPCCSGSCTDGLCQPPPAGTCKDVGQSCATSVDCCNSNQCEQGVCTAQTCRDVGEACTDGGDCCTLSCNGGVCADNNPESPLRAIGESCTGAAQCASNNCQGGKCVASYSCRAQHDVCTRHEDCCNTNCSVNDGVSAGYCVPLSGGCAVDGQPCIDGNGCCSKTCSDQGFGAKVCAPAGGCTIEDTPCDTAAECCSMGSSPKPPTCEAKPSSPNATLCAVGGCNPVGMVCGKATTYADGTTIPSGPVSVSARAPASCCSDTGNGGTCKLDRAGIPRCFGGGDVTGCPTGYTGEPGCCIAAGNECAFSDQCCDGSPCLPDGTGKLVCAAAAQCKALGDPCDPTAATPECCSGTVCPTDSEFAPSCSLPGSSCTANGETCSTAGDCCSNICSGGVCSEPVECQPQGSACTASADCCTGLSCNIPTGSSVGTCATATCQSAGQTCSPTLGCCNGTACRTSTGADCTGDSPCTCTVIFG